MNISDALLISLCMTAQIISLQIPRHWYHVDLVGESVPDIIGYNEHRPTAILYARARMKPKIRKPDVSTLRHLRAGVHWRVHRSIDFTIVAR